MTKLMQKAIAALSRLPQDRQDEVAEYILAEFADPMRLTDEERDAIAEGRADFEAGRVATEAEVGATFDRLKTA